MAKDENFEKAIVNYGNDKYSVVVDAADWVKVLRKKNENKSLTDADLIKIALDNILNGTITHKMVVDGANNLKATQLKEEEEARKEAERKAKEPLKL